MRFGEAHPRRSSGGDTDRTRFPRRSTDRPTTSHTPRSGPGTLSGVKTVSTGLLGRSRGSVFRAQNPAFQHGTSVRASSRVNDGDGSPFRLNPSGKRFPKGGRGA